MTSQINSWLAHISPGMAQNSIEAYQWSAKFWLDWAGDRTAASIQSADLNAYIQFLLARGNKPKTVKYRLAQVKRFFQHLADNNEVPADIIDQFQPRRLIKLRVIKPVKRAITEAEHHAIMATTATSYGKTWWIAACKIAWATGLRMSDVCLLRWENIDWKNEVIRVIPQKTKAIGKTASIPMDGELSDYLASLAKQPYYTSPFVIPDMAGRYEAGGRCELKTMFIALAKKAGCDGISFHCYRHAFVSRLINAGVEPLVISSMTGQSIAQIKDYAHVSMDAQKDALDRARQTMHKHALRQKGIGPATTLELSEAAARGVRICESGGPPLSLQ